MQSSTLINHQPRMVAMPDRPPLSATEAAARLGVKRQTLYAYVSRGLLRSRPAAGGRGSVFDAAEVDGLLRRSRAGRDSAQELTIATAVSSIADGELRYRGRLAPELARTQPFEAVASLLWTGELAWQPFVANAGARDAVEAVERVTPPGARLLDRVRLATDVAAVTDPLRFELATTSVTACGRALVAVLVDTLPWQGRRRRTVPLALPGHPDRPDAIASRLWPRLSELAPTPAAIRTLNG